ncbi:ATP-binding protein [Candidatus Gracilibacteria bacterium]|nr:ATP-binding protein [Candidatus Gracilibacteria bacterium]
MKIRKIYQNILNEIDNNLILLLIGARQVGKTTLLKQIKNYLDKKDVKTYFLNLEDPDIKILLNIHPNKLFEITGSGSEDKQVIFIDEIQYLDNPTNFLKYIFDEYKDNIKLIVSGSSSFYIDQKFKDSLIGRKKVFNIYTLDFEEFLDFKDENELKDIFYKTRKIPTLQKNLFNKLLDEYITYGGYPEIVLTKDNTKKIERLYDYSFDYIKKDIYEAKIQDQDKFLNLLKILANQTGELINMNELANTLGLSQPTIEKYIYVMQKSFQIALIKPFYSNIRKELTKMPKIYFLDLGIRNSLLRNFDNISSRIDKGPYLENIFFREFLFKQKSGDSIKFRRTQAQNEVDFILNESEAFEIKFDKKQVKESKYKVFKEQYKNIKLNYISFEELMNFL